MRTITRAGGGDPDNCRGAGPLRGDPASKSGVGLHLCKDATKTQSDPKATEGALFRPFGPTDSSENWSMLP
jgi:hypothetical protein